MGNLYRIGTFFYAVGLILLILFVGSIMGKATHGIYLLLSFAALVVGFLFRRNKTIKKSGRFGMLHRLNERRDRRRGEKRNNRRGPLTAMGNEDEEENNRNEE